MKPLCTVIVFVVAQLGGPAPQFKAADRQAKCCCCETAVCHCGCQPPAQEPASPTPDTPESSICVCGDVPLAPPVSSHIELTRRVAFCGLDTVSAVLISQNLSQAPRFSVWNHAPPPDIAHIGTVVLLF